MTDVSLQINTDVDRARTITLNALAGMKSIKQASVDKRGDVLFARTQRGLGQGHETLTFSFAEALDGSLINLTIQLKSIVGAPVLLAGPFGGKQVNRCLDEVLQALAKSATGEGLSVFRNGEAANPTEEVIHTGPFQYAGGHPDLGEPGGDEVRVTRKHVEVVKRSSLTGKQTVILSIPVADISSVRHDQMGSGGWSAPDQFIVVVLERGGRTFDVRLKAEGIRQQKDAFQLYGVLNTVLAQQ